MGIGMRKLTLVASHSEKDWTAKETKQFNRGFFTRQRIRKAASQLMQKKKRRIAIWGTVWQHRGIKSKCARNAWSYVCTRWRYTIQRRKKRTDTPVERSFSSLIRAHILWGMLEKSINRVNHFFHPHVKDCTQIMLDRTEDNDLMSSFFSDCLVGNFSDDSWIFVTIMNRHVWFCIID